MSSAGNPPLLKMALLALGAVNLALAAFAWQVYTQEELPSATPASQWTPPKLASSTDRPPIKPIEAFVQTLQRPLFQRTRQPWTPPVNTPKAPDAPTLPAPEAAAPVEKLDAVLNGIIASPAGKKALLTTKDQPTGSWIGIGEKVHNWTLEGIGSDSVTFRNGTQVTHIDLYASTTQTP